MRASGAAGFKVGDSAYLKLDGGFDPPWRQCMVVTPPTAKGKNFLVVRVRGGELQGRWKDLSSMELGEQKFILVEGTVDRLRTRCTQPHCSLEVNPNALLVEAMQLVEAEGLSYATASEEVEPMRVGRDALVESEDESDTQEESGDSLEGDAIMKMLKRAGLGKPEKGMPLDEPKKKKKKGRSRYALLNRDSSAKSTDKLDLDTLLQKSLAGAATGSGGVDINALVQMQILKELKGRKNKKQIERTDDSDESNSSVSDSSGEDRVKLKGAGKALRAYRQTYRSMKRQPLRHVRRYVKEVEEQLGATSSTPYSLSDMSRKLNFGKQKTLMRLHFAISEALQTLLSGKTDQTALQLTLLLRSIHQCSLDNGSWRVAWLLTHLVDPLQQPKFGGEAQDLEIIASYVRAMGDLEKRSRTWQPGQNEDDQENASGGKKTKGKGKGKKNDDASHE